MYGKMIHNVLGNLGDPFPRIRRYGTHEFLIELVPTGMSKETAPWIPNYTLHVIGCGMLSTAMREWYEAHDVPAPWAFSALTLMAMHFWNEVMETGPYEGYSVDEISDIYIFDIGGIILFSFDNVNDFFHRKLNLSDWSLQASITLPHGRVNAGQFFSIKWELPFWNEHYFFYRFGMGHCGDCLKKLILLTASLPVSGFAQNIWWTLTTRCVTGQLKQAGRLAYSMTGIIHSWVLWS
jgi:hypothetical protein